MSLNHKHMAKQNYQKEIKRVTQKIVEDYKPEKIILFGSYAWGRPHEWSDLDLFIVKESKKKRWNREYDLRMKLIGNSFPPLDLLIYTPEEVRKRFDIGDFFIRDIFKRGKVLYAEK